MPAQLNFYKEFPGKPLNIPFEEDDLVYVKFKIKKTTLDKSTIYNKAVDYYITHYFPEFYRNMKDPKFDGDNTHYDTLRTILKNATKTENPNIATFPPGSKKIFIARLDLGRSIFDLRREMESLLPSFRQSLDFFNSQNNIDLYPNGQTEIELKDVLSEMNSFDTVMKDFSKQKDNYSGAVPIGGINFKFLGQDVSKIIKAILGDVLKDIQATTGGGAKSYKAQEGDLLTIYFSKRSGPYEGQLVATPPPDPLNLFNIPKTAISRIGYSTAATAGSQELKVGYLSLMKYRKKFRDPLTLKTLQNYKDVISQANEHSTAGSQFPMFEFLSETLPDQIQTDLNTDNFFSFPTPNEQNDSDNNALLGEAIKLGLIDVTDTRELQEGLSALTTEELAQLQTAVDNNPELAERVYQEERRKNLETGINIADNVERALEIGPLAVFEEGSAVDRILGKIGLKALAKEALICLTFGVNFEIGRISAAVGNVMEEELLSRPAMDPLQFEIF